MKLLIFGATGGSGKLVLEQALEQGHYVTAFVRNLSKLNIKNPNLKIVQGDVLDLSSIKVAMKGHDAVICCIGTPANKVGNIRSKGTKNIIDAMEKTEIKRFICQTSLGYADSVEVLKQTPFFFKNIIVPLLLKKTFAEHSLQEEFIKQSSLDWIIVRPGTLTNGKLTGTYRHGFPYNDKSVKVKISRADVADFILKQLNSNTYLNKISGLSY